MKNWIIYITAEHHTEYHYMTTDDDKTARDIFRSLLPRYEDTEKSLRGVWQYAPETPEEAARYEAGAISVRPYMDDVELTEEEYKAHSERVKREAARTKKMRKRLKLESYTWVTHWREKEAELSKASADIIVLHS